MPSTYRESSRQYRNLTIADWMTPVNKTRLVGEPRVKPAPAPVPSPRATAASPKEPSDMELVASLGRGRWRSTPKDKHVIRMCITAAVSVFAEVMRPYLERKMCRIFSSFSEAVDAILPYWDRLNSTDRDAWARRAVDTNKTDHFIYLRVARQTRKASDEMEKTAAGGAVSAAAAGDGEEEKGYETDPDELPGIVCGGEETKPLNYVTGGRHLLPIRQRRLVTYVE